ncbi:MAG: mandelate racemase/muconate lactonizing protein, partial [Chloroflexi bacterium]|nr:mandelate racemase/muconate lactonizing protein [Chloroflexota bacterium]
MNIEAIRAVQVGGTLEHEGEFWEDRLVRPTDLYEPHRQGGPRTLPKLGEGRYRIDAVFLEIEAEGVVGRAGPIGGALAQSILQQFKPLLLGEDARATERIWDLMYRSAVHGRKGPTMMAISAIDCALWDLKGKALNQPVYRLLGGPTRESIPAYASTLGFSVEPADVARRAADFAAAGYRAQKWFFKRGPADGKAGMEQNETLVRTVREAAGDDADIMFDAWMSWDPDYALAMARRVERYNVRWIEEPLLPDKIAA